MAQQAEWVKEAIEYLTAPPEPEPDLIPVAPPEEVWRLRFVHWIEAMAKWVREESEGGGCFEVYGRGETESFLSPGSLRYAELGTEHPKAYVSLPVYAARHYRINLDQGPKLLGHDYQAALEVDLIPGSKPVEAASRHLKRRIRDYGHLVESMEKRETQTTADKRDMDHYKQAIARMEAELHGEPEPKPKQKKPKRKRAVERRRSSAGGRARSDGA